MMEEENFSEARVGRIGLGAMTSSGNSVKKPSEMERALDKLKLSVGCVDEMLGSLNTRLSPVLRPEPPRDVGDSLAKDPGFSTTIAQRINKETETLYRLADAIMDIRNRLEL